MRKPKSLLGLSALFVLACNPSVFPCFAGEPISLALDEPRGRLEVRFNGQPLLVYAFAPNQFKPYVRALYSLSGINILRNSPPDHLHHHGLMYAIRINGVNFWEENDQPGIEKPIRLLSHRTGSDAKGLPLAEFSQLIYWVPNGHRRDSDSGAAAFLTEQRTITTTVDEKAGEVALRWQAAFVVGRGVEKVKLHGSAYNGLGLRLPEAFDHSAKHVNSEETPYTVEQRQDVIAARWSAVSQPIEGRDLIVALFNRSSNAGEARFFTMLNPFAYLAVTQNLEQHPLEYKAGGKFAIDYLLCVYSEKKSPAFLHQRYEQWEKP